MVLLLFFNLVIFGLNFNEFGILLRLGVLFLSPEDISRGRQYPFPLQNRVCHYIPIRFHYGSNCWNYQEFLNGEGWAAANHQLSSDLQDLLPSCALPLKCRAVFELCPSDR
jgi:hypothetical protein